MLAHFNMPSVGLLAEIAQAVRALVGGVLGAALNQTRLRAECAAHLRRFLIIVAIIACIVVPPLLAR